MRPVIVITLITVGAARRPGSAIRVRRTTESRMTSRLRNDTLFKQSHAHQLSPAYSRYFFSTTSKRHRRPQRHRRPPAQKVRVLFAAPDLHHAGKVNGHHGRDVGHAKPVGGNEVAVSQVIVQRGKELLQP